MNYAISWLNGFGVGVWRNRWYEDGVLWTVSLGPLTIWWRVTR
jgi:hypothetical protein